ncbi:hypothetical protein GCM10011369_18860 [Neiella marina]|uniref:ATPase AAA-type core domain-containing protein n=1 Tax=Neiella marina TaxID=508461 RepID=A0A8J2U540_9GAMM|nr:AAA family ATPase [Neiella marina]GGA77226.1 hypothetical protein GCM10011369_18860 [Neiella marina]
MYIGENGSGKSRKLSCLSKQHIEQEKKVLAIATSNNDRFPRRNPHKDYHYMGVRLGRFVAIEAIKGAFKKVYKNHDHFLRNIFKILDYVGYENKIGIKVNGFSENPVELLEEFRRKSDIQDFPKSWSHEQTTDLFLDITRLQQQLKGKLDEIIWAAEGLNSTFLADESLVALFANEKLFKKAKIFKSIDIILEKNGHKFDLSDASSGELSLISTAAFISSRINPESGPVSIFIDEPENSLHPKWQKNYLSNLLNIFPYNRIDFFIATHSPLVVDGAVKEDNADVFRYQNGRFVLLEQKSRNIEDALIDQFDIVTSENNALSERCIDLINDTSSGKIDQSQALFEISRYKSFSQESNQLEFLNGVVDIIKGLNNAKG